MKSKGSRKTRAVRPARLELERQTLRDLKVRGQGPAGGQEAGKTEACKLSRFVGCGGGTAE
jgi:hypothetical protein